MDESVSVSPILQITVNKMTGDMQFVGIFYIIIGALQCLSIIGAIVGIPLIICGLRLRESADSFRGYLTTNDTGMLENALERQSRFFFIQKILLIISIVIFVLYIIFIIVFGISMFTSMSHYRSI
ncbi:MAG: DUF5362 domain-containing protein [Ignavibacteriaceae bacterium]